MRRARDQRDSFQSGTLAPEYAGRFDETAKLGLKTGKNIMLLNSGAVIRRPGSVPLTPAKYDRVFSVEGLVDGLRDFYFKAGEVAVWDGETLETLITGCPWTADDVDIMQVVEVRNALVVVSESFYPQTLTWDGTDWVRSNLSFVDGIGGSIRQPYYRYADRGVTIQPSATTGTVTVTASADVFNEDYVGTRIRYLGKEIEITAYTNATTVTGTVRQRLYPTYNVTLASASGFQVGQLVEGEDTQIRGVVAGISSNVLTIVMVEGYDDFDSTTPEKLIGPESKSEISSTSTATTPAPVLQWDEEMISATHGYPAVAGYHDNRLLLAGFRDAPNQLAAFVTGVYNDFNISDGSDNEAFIYGIGDNEAARILHLVSAEQLILLTDKGHYHVATRAEAPFTPSGVASAGFRVIGPESATTCRPAIINEGVLFASSADDLLGPRIMLIQPSGNVLRSWTSSDVSQYGYELIKDPREIVAQNGIGNRPERLVIVRNGDGSLAVATIVQGQNQPGWYLWKVVDGVVSVASIRRRLVVISLFSGNRVTMQMDLTQVIDRTVVGTSAADAGYQNDRVDIVVGDHVVGEVVVNLDGTIDDYEAASIMIGRDFDVEVTPVPFIHPRDPSPRNRRGVRGFVSLDRSGPIRVNGQSLGNFTASYDLSTPPVARTRIEEVFMAGLTDRPELKIEQRAGEGGPLTITGVTIEAAD